MTEETAAQEQPAFKKSAENEWMELIKTAFWAIAVALVIRTFLFEPFNIPSGSMKPNLLVGDYLFVSKYSYGYSRYSLPFGLPLIPGRVMASEPQQGDVAVFKLPSNTSTDYIKRVIGLPGDRIQMTRGRLHINGKVLPREPMGVIVDTETSGNDVQMYVYEETLPNGVKHIIYEEGDNGPLDNTREFVVPEGHYFMMGDNRDNSQDSRVQDLVGFVPFQNFVGRAERLFFSTNGNARIWEFWRWPMTVRYTRLLMEVK
ncbi:MAG: signal peptidase I [Alphaproteobacteria bacterium]|nr:signal peptidase I [Alphaproteobacteria bacterium]